MPVFLDYNDDDFETNFAKLLNAKREDSPDVDDTVSDIIHNVRLHGDKALFDYTQKFDRFALSAQNMRMSSDEIEAQISLVSATERGALEQASKRIWRYHERQKPQDAMWQEDNGAELGWRWTPVSAAGLYVPVRLSYS